MRRSHWMLFSVGLRSSSLNFELGELALELNILIIIHSSLRVDQVDRANLDRLTDLYVATNGPVRNSKLKATALLPEAEHHYVIAALTVNPRTGKSSSQNFRGQEGRQGGRVGVPWPGVL